MGELAERLSLRRSLRKPSQRGCFSPAATCIRQIRWPVDYFRLSAPPPMVICVTPLISAQRPRMTAADSTVVTVAPEVLPLSPPVKPPTTVRALVGPGTTDPAGAPRPRSNCPRDPPATVPVPPALPPEPNVTTLCLLVTATLVPHVIVMAPVDVDVPASPAQPLSFAAMVPLNFDLPSGNVTPGTLVVQPRSTPWRER